VPKACVPLAIEYVQVAALHPDPGNPRSMDEAGLEALTASITAFAVVDPILARREDGLVISGHQRLRAAIRAGLEVVPVIWLDLSLAEARTLGLALNQIGGTFDEPLLGRLLADLRAGGEVDLALTGFAKDELGRLLAGLEARDRSGRPEAFDLDAAMTLAATTRTRPGELWALGEHRLAVGDATDPAVIDRLLGDRRPAMTFADPPYGVDFGHHGGQAPRTRRRTMANDNLAPDAWAAFVGAFATLVVERTAGAIYVCMSSQAWPTVAQALADAGGHWSDTLIYRKDRFVLGRADYQRAYEPIWYGWKEGRRHFWCGDRDQSDVWDIDRPDASPLHPTAKPLVLVQRAITNSSRPGDLVFDPFAGSGTTLIAADRTGRTCATVEILPRYADVVLARWESFTGLTAQRIESASAEGEAA
jgi:DNA modification methylase